MAKQYDISEEEYQRLLKNAKRRAELRTEFQKKLYDPSKVEGGHVFDAAIQRFTAMRVNSYDHFKPTAKNVRIGFLYFIIPVTFFSYMVKRERDYKEEKYRTGQVAYKDRSFKLA